MTTDIFVNLPTSDLPRAKAFFEAIGWEINPLFSDDNAACVVIDEHVYLMILTREYFSTFTDVPIADPKQVCGVETALSRESRAGVDELVDAALASGGTEPREAQDLGFMYSRTFHDPDGNQFSILHMDPVAAEQGPEAFAA